MGKIPLDADILNFWFVETTPEFWFKKDDDFDAKTPKLLELLYGNVTKYGGSISAEHGIGQVKRDQLAKVKSPAIINTMKSIKAALDPKNLMNPGKVI